MKNATFQQRLKELIEEKGISQSELSKMSGVSTSNITRYLKGEYKAKQDYIYLLAKALNVSPVYLMGLSDNREAINITPKNEKDTFDNLVGKISLLNEKQMKDVIRFIDTFILDNKGANHER